MTAATSSVPSRAAIETHQNGKPDTKLDVPSSGSMIQIRAPAAPTCAPPSSPRKASLGIAASNRFDDARLALAVREGHEVVLLLLLDRAVRQVAPVRDQDLAAGLGSEDGGIEKV